MQYAHCCLVGIRTQESLDRWRTIHGNNRLNSYHNLMWTRRLGYDLYNAYPIYDWTTEDIWTAYARFQMGHSTKCTSFIIKPEYLWTDNV